jgi:peptidoglycan/xylan/chitin deacetylase (PgdA/CDA1 family)
MAVNRTIFFRNDDVRETLDKELIDLTELCFKHNIPISHAVEPANVSKDVVDWLLLSKKQKPHLIEIIQHGYDHNKKDPKAKMEFGGARTFEDQFSKIKEGKELMDQYFGKSWVPIFTFPFGTYNFETLRSVNELGYQAISSKIDYSLKTRLKNKVGNMIGKDFLFNKKISYHNNRRKHFKFKELSVSANLIKKYTGNNTADHYSKQEISAQIEQAGSYSPIIGVLFHHRFHTQHIEMVEQLIIELKDKYSFSTIMNLVR